MITVALVESDEDLAACMALREEVFIVEQSVPVDLERDGLDPTATHLLVRWEGAPAGTLRLRAVDGAGKLERVCVAKTHRGKGLADALTKAALTEIAAQGLARAKLSAQVDVIGFYERHGFTAHGPVYDDAGIPHRDMVRDPL